MAQVLWHVDAELVAKPGEGVCIRDEADMLEDNRRHWHPPELDGESLKPLRRVWLDGSPGRDEETSLHMRYMNR